MNALASLLVSFGFAACSSDPYAATSLSHVPAEEPAQDTILSSSEQSAISSSFNSLAAGRSPVRRPASAATFRWTDIPNAVAFACDDVEMAVVTKTIGDRRCSFTLKTIDDVPGQLLITRVDDPRVYLASASIGRATPRPQAAQQLLDALEKHMRAYAAKRQYPQD